MKTLTIHTAAYERSHGRKPSTRTRGSWYFKATRSWTCYDADLTGDLIPVRFSTLGEAIRTMRAAGYSGEFAVMP